MQWLSDVAVKFDQKLSANNTSEAIVLTEVGDGHVNGETGQTLVYDRLRAPDSLMVEHEHTDAVEFRLVAKVMLHINGAGRMAQGPHNEALNVSRRLIIASATPLVTLRLHVHFVDDLVLGGLDGLCAKNDTSIST